MTSKIFYYTILQLEKLFLKPNLPLNLLCHLIYYLSIDILLSKIRTCQSLYLKLTSIILKIHQYVMEIELELELIEMDDTGVEPTFGELSVN